MKELKTCKSIKVEISTPDAEAIRGLLSGEPALNKSYQILDGAMLTVKRHDKPRGIGAIEILEFVIEFGTSVSTGLISAWLYDNFKKYRAKVAVNDRPVQRLDKDCLTESISNESEELNEVISDSNDYR